MKNVKKIYRPGTWFLLLLCFACLPNPLSAKILVLVPHPDDDVLLAAGVIARATARGEPVKVVYLTNGDFNGVEQGYTRQNEAVQAETHYLGMKENNLIFLGYPDGRLTKLINEYPKPGDQYSTQFDQAQTYGRRGLGFTDYHSYRFGIPANYNSYNIIRDLYDVIYRFRPDHIFTTSPYDYHSDHSAAYKLLQLTLTNLAKTDIALRPTIHTAIVHFGAIGSKLWPEAGNPCKYYNIPYNFSKTSLNWFNRESIDVPLTMQSPDLRSNPKYLAMLEHQSQFQVSNFLNQFLHKDEVFWVEGSYTTDYPPLVQAGPDLFLREGTTCRLNGAGSKTSFGKALTYNWQQTGGRQAQFLDVSNPTPSIKLPLLDRVAVAASSEKKINIEPLTFQLVVSNGVYTSIPDSMTVYVIPRNDEQGPKIDIRYRTTQAFSQLKLVKPWVHVSGQVQDNAGIASLTYALNNNAEQPIQIGKQPFADSADERKRISLKAPNRQPRQPANSMRRQPPASQVFNLNIPLAALQEDVNHIIIKATDKAGRTSYEVVTVNYRSENLWPLMLVLIVAFIVIVPRRRV